MSISIRPLSALVLSAMFLLASGCSSEMSRGRGFTDCNGVTCQPGQYCMSAAFCDNGCLSDVNCADNQTCVGVGSGTWGEGFCESAPMMMPPDDAGTSPVDPSAECVRICNALVSCAPGGSVTACLNACPTLPADCRSCLDNAGESCDLAETCASRC